VIPLTHQELADLAGLSRETTTRMLNSFQKAGVVKLQSRQVMLTDLKTLAKYST
jgi:CRP-like cAMP-binding protein